MNTTRLKALVVKELLQIMRDPSSILISFVLPAILLFIYGYGISLDYKHLKIGVVLEDSSQTAQNMLERFIGSPYFSVETARHRYLLQEKLIDGSIRGIVVIPSYFSKQMPHPIQVITDGSDPNTAHFVENYVQAALTGVRTGTSKILPSYPPISSKSAFTNDAPFLGLTQPQPRFWFNEALDSHNVLIPGSLALIMTLIGTLLTALVIAREWERGTMESLLASPITATELVLGKCIAYFLLGMLSFLFACAIAFFFFHVPLRGSLLALTLTTMVFLCTALGMGLLISTLLKNQFAASQAAIVSAFLPAFVLSGFIFEISSMPLPIQWLTYLLPVKYYVSSLQTLFLAGNVWSLLSYNVCIMSAMGIALFFCIAYKTRRRLD